MLKETLINSASYGVIQEEIENTQNVGQMKSKSLYIKKELEEIASKEE